VRIRLNQERRYAIPTPQRVANRVADSLKLIILIFVKKTNIMPTRVERLKKRRSRVVNKGIDKIAAAPDKKGGGIAKRAVKKYGRINKKIVKTKARVEARNSSMRTAKKVVRKAVRKVKRADKKVARVVKKGVKKMNKGKATPAAYNKMVSTKKATPSAAALAAYKAKKAAKMKKGGTISRGQGPSLQEKAAKRKM